MNIIRNSILGVVALAGFAMATPAQAYDHYRYYGHHYYRSGPRVGVTFGSPYYYSYRPYYYSYSDPYYDYGYARPYPYYGYGPGVTFAFGGHRGYYYHNYHHHHHHH